MHSCVLRLNILAAILSLPYVHGYVFNPIIYKQNPAPDGHRCGICPTYWDKICGYDSIQKIYMIFDNHCVMDLYNCMEGAKFYVKKYQECVFFGNFAYVHGFKKADMDYGEDHIIVKGSEKSPHFVDP